MKSFLLIILAAIYLTAGANSLAVSSSNTVRSNLIAKDANQADMKAVAAGNTDFAFALYAKLKDNPKAVDEAGNLFFSPYSISTVLAMTCAGAGGETQKQMTETLHFMLEPKRLNPAFGALQKQLVQPDKSAGYQLLAANALWAQQGQPLVPKFAGMVRTDYDARISQLDFIEATEKSRQTINRWVEEKTKEKIRNLIPAGGVNTDTRLVLTNAIYFKGEWTMQFEKKNTKETDFFVSAVSKVKVPMMYLEDHFKYWADDELQVLELSYKGRQLSMLIILPRAIEGLKAIEDALTPASIENLLSKMHYSKVEVFLPKFKLTWGTFSLKATLASMGMHDAFDAGKADFSGMDGKRDLFLSDVFHKAVIVVNEEGTEAAAATGGTMALTSVERTNLFRADHPFIFIIRDSRSGSILFIGHLADPAVR
jgi:serpin B